MASADPKTKTTYATTDWADHQKGRPSYPASLTQIIYNYGRRHSKAGWERLDIGAGSGIVPTNFMPNFKVVQIFDPSPANGEQARRFLSSWADRHGLNVALE